MDVRGLDPVSVDKNGLSRHGGNKVTHGENIFNARGIFWLIQCGGLREEGLG